MSANGISHLPTKQARQLAKLALAESKRASAGNGYRALNVLDVSLLPSSYVGNVAIPNTHPVGLVKGRPWVTRGEIITPTDGTDLVTSDGFTIVTDSGLILQTDVNPVPITLPGTDIFLMVDEANNSLTTEDGFFLEEEYTPALQLSTENGDTLINEDGINTLLTEY